MSLMRGVRLPGDSSVEHVEVPVPEPGHGQVLLRVRASSICGSDIRAIYREHLGHGAEAYRGVIAGHEPCGDVVAVGPGKVAENGERIKPEVKKGDRVLYGKYSGTEVTVDGEELLILRESDILATV